MADGNSPTEQVSVGHRSKVTLGSIARYYSAGSGDIGSNFGAMTDRLALMAHRSVRCRLCKETPGVRELPPEEMKQRWLRVHRLEEAISAARRALNSERTRKLLEDREALGKELCAETECPACKGTGYTKPTRAHRAHAGDGMFTTARCSKCWGCGEPVGEVVAVQSSIGERKTYYFASLLPTDATAERGDRCQGCGGATYTVPITVRETGSSKHGKAPSRDLSGGDDGTSGEAAPSWVDEDELAERGRVSRVLDELRRQDPTVALAIEAFNGPEGDRWGAHRWGRGFTLWQFTGAGRRLATEAAERSRRGHGHLVSPLDLLATERETEQRGSAPDHHRRALLDQANRQAAEIHIRMMTALRGIEAA
jgi:hypothetical protein